MKHPDVVQNILMKLRIGTILLSIMTYISSSNFPDSGYGGIYIVP